MFARGRDAARCVKLWRGVSRVMERRYRWLRGKEAGGQTPVRSADGNLLFVKCILACTGRHYGRFVVALAWTGWLIVPFGLRWADLRIRRAHTATVPPITDPAPKGAQHRRLERPVVQAKLRFQLRLVLLSLMTIPAAWLLRNTLAHSRKLHRRCVNFSVRPKLVLGEWEVHRDH